MVQKVFSELDYRLLAAGPAEAPYVLGYWQQHNPAATPCPFTVLPDGSFKLLVRHQPGQPPELVLCGIWTRPFATSIPPQGTVRGVRCKLPAAEWLVTGPLPLNGFRALPPAAGLGAELLATHNLPDLAQRVAELAAARPPLPPSLAALFAALYHPAGPLPVRALAAAGGWSVRHITRYFQARFCLSPKAYADVLRSYGAVQRLQPGDLYAAGPYCDQSHGIRDVKKHTGATPRQLLSQRDSRYIQLNPAIAIAS